MQPAIDIGSGAREGVKGWAATMVKGGTCSGGHQQPAGQGPGNPPAVPDVPNVAKTSGGSFRGLASGLAKAAPSAQGSISSADNACDEDEKWQ